MLWEKEKLLFMSNFSFSRSVFKRLVLQTHKNQGLFGKGLSNLTGNTFLFINSLADIYLRYFLTGSQTNSKMTPAGSSVLKALIAEM